MPYDRFKHHRRSIRLPSYDYRRSGAYFVTICTENRECILEADCIANAIQWAWRAVGKYSRAATGDEFIVMPNHVHGIIILDPKIKPDIQRTSGRQRLSLYCHPIVESESLGAIIRAFKSSATKRINRLRGAPGLPVFQRGYHEEIIWNQTALNQIRQYIKDNPRNWRDDPNNPTNWPTKPTT